MWRLGTLTLIGSNIKRYAHDELESGVLFSSLSMIAMQNPFYDVLYLYILLHMAQLVVFDPIFPGITVHGQSRCALNAEREVENCGFRAQRSHCNAIYIHTERICKVLPPKVGYRKSLQNSPFKL